MPAQRRGALPSLVRPQGIRKEHTMHGRSVSTVTAYTAHREWATRPPDDRDEPWTVHAITSPRYARVHHDELAGRVLDLMAQHPAWHLPLGYKDGVMGAERVPSGAYLGDRDMFLFLVDGNRNLDDPTDGSHAGLFRGFMLRNSDVGAAALTLDVFLYRNICGNHIIWGFRHIAG